MLALINAHASRGDGDLEICVPKICEWMLHEKLPSGIQARVRVKDGLYGNDSVLCKGCPF